MLVTWKSFSGSQGLAGGLTLMIETDIWKDEWISYLIMCYSIVLLATKDKMSAWEITQKFRSANIKIIK